MYQLYLTVLIVGLVQSDKTSNVIKRRTMLNQEIFYKSHKNTDLEFYRKNLRLQNSSFSGSVSGFLYDENTPKI